MQTLEAKGLVSFRWVQYNLTTTLFFNPDSEKLAAMHTGNLTEPELASDIEMSLGIKLALQLTSNPKKRENEKTIYALYKLL